MENNIKQNVYLYVSVIVDLIWVVSLFSQTIEQGQLEEKGQNRVIHREGTPVTLSQIQVDTTERGWVKRSN